MSTSPSPLLLARRYRMLQRLGSGSVGTVYLAQDELRNHEVAVKTLRKDGVDRSTSERLTHEFESLCTIDHKRVAKVFDFGFTGHNSVPYFTREFIDGSPLEPGPPTSSASIAVQPILEVLDGLAHLHERNLLHLDLHPGNVIVANDGRGAVLIDIGLHHAGTASKPTLNRWSEFPPEYSTGAAPTPASDLFMAGRLLAYALTGRLTTSMSAIEELPGCSFRLTRQLERIVAKATHAKPSLRFASALEMRDALARAIGAESESFSPANNAFIGREREVAHVDELLHRATAGACTGIYFAGATGTGKSRLLTNVRHRAQLRGWHVAEVRGRDDTMSGPAVETAISRSADLADTSISWLEPLDPIHGGSPTERATRAAKAYWQRKRDRPLFLLIDDVGQLDEESQLLLTALLGGTESESADGRGLAILMAGLPSQPKWTHCQTLTLKPLSFEDRSLLLDSLVAPKLLEDETRTLVLDYAADDLRLLRAIGESLGKRLAAGENLSFTAGLPDLVAAELQQFATPRQELSSEQYRVLEVSEKLAGPSTSAEIAAAAKLSRFGALRILLHLSRSGHITAVTSSIGLLYSSRARSNTTQHRDEDETHRRMVAYFESLDEMDARSFAHLSYHRLKLGSSERAVSDALTASRLFVRGSLFSRAVSLLSALSSERLSFESKLAIAEQLSEISSLCGEHEYGIDAITPILSDAEISPSQKLRLTRRLGVHLHRNGNPSSALTLFSAQIDRSSIEDEIRIQAECAEIHTLQGNLDEAEQACETGLSSLKDLEPGRFRRHMEVMLRASKGHLELRRLRPNQAFDELRRAIELAGEECSTSERIAILNNLGIAANQMDDLDSALKTFGQAQALLEKTRDFSAAAKIACNTAVLRAKLGQIPESIEQIKKAEDAASFAGDHRLTFFLTYSKAVAAYLVGNARTASEEFELAIPLGRDLGDEYLVSFGEVYLAEIAIWSADYVHSCEILRSIVSRASISPLLSRMAYARLLLAETLLGESADSTLQAMTAVPRTRFSFLEAWNDVLVASAILLRQGDARRHIERAKDVFQRMTIPAGTKIVGALELINGREMMTDSFARTTLRQLRKAPKVHAFVDVLHALVSARLGAQLSDKTPIYEDLREANSSILGTSFLELEFRCELLLCGLALESGELQEARKHYHRASNDKDLIVQRIPRERRERFESQSRFDLFRTISRRLELPKDLPSTPLKRGLHSHLGIVGNSDEIRALIRRIERYADHELPLGILGEPGSGKELVARAVHARSSRRDGPFVPVSCASVPVELLPSEFFGVTQGAYTGASEDRPGLFDAARGGTLLLDGIDQLPLESQASIQAALSSRSYRPIGSMSSIPLDARILSTTSEDLEQLVEQGVLRQDLAQTLCRLELHVPPLRIRNGDLELLAKHLLDCHAKRLGRPTSTIGTEALRVLNDHDWPGNVRELETVLLRALIELSKDGEISAQDLSVHLPGKGSDHLFNRRELNKHSLADLRIALEREYLLSAFESAKGNPREMMKSLGVKRTRLYTWFKKVGLDIRELRREHGFD